MCGVDFPEHRRLNYRGRDGVDGDAAFGELLAQRLIIVKPSFISGAST